MSSSTDPAVIKRIEACERMCMQLLGRVYDLEQAGSPDGVVDASTAAPADEMQHVAARICQKIEKERGGFDNDLIGA